MRSIDQDSNLSTWSTTTTGFSVVAGETPNLPVIYNPANSSILINDITPTITFDLSDPDVGDLIKYQIQIDNNSDYSSPEVDFTEASFSVSPRTAVEFTTTPLADGIYFCRVKAFDEIGLESNWQSF